MRNKLPITFFFLLYTFILSAMDKDSDKKSSSGEFKRIYFGVSVTPMVGFRYLQKNFTPAGISDSQVKGVIESTNNGDLPQIGVAAGLKGGIKLTRWLAVETGVEYALIRYRHNAGQYYVDSVYSGVNFSTADSFKTTENDLYHYMNVPISLNFTLGKKKVRGIISVGASLNFLLKKKISYNYSYSDGRSISGTTVDRYDFNKFNVSPFLGIGADFYLTKALVLRLMPIAQMQALKNINTPITEYLWYAGLNVSLQLGFLNAGK